jgi:hypothetical protein
LDHTQLAQEVPRLRKSGIRQDDAGAVRKLSNEGARNIFAISKNRNKTNAALKHHAVPVGKKAT